MPSYVLQPGEIHLWCTRLACPEEELDSHECLLAADERRRADRFVFERDRRRFVVARASLRRLLSGYLGEPPGAIAFHYGPQGKPEIRSHRLRFNLSHSADVALIAVGVDTEVGVDVEHFHDELQVDDLAPVVCASSEREALARLEPAARRDAFGIVWTRKEAWMKAVGLGFSADPKACVVSLAEDDPDGLLQVPGDEPSAWTLRTFRPAPGFIASYAVRARPLRAYVFDSGHHA